MFNDKKPPADNADDPNTDISPEERALLDDSMLNSASVDNMNLKDRHWIPLMPMVTPNESTANLTGEDLDIPGAELDDANEEIGEEDEENNMHSPADQKQQHRYSVKHILHELLHVFTHADKGIFSFAWQLLTRPGHIAQDLVAGKRKKYFNLFQYLIIIVGLATWWLLKQS
ncbi:MAG: DUF3667 domain-containing protein [Chitinophagaceae bacterium]|nr:DUF3667 domain-containing protein [Chitinophagaceae bacterium]